MKPLVIMLLLAIPVRAQTLADIARAERLRKANLKSVRVFTADEAKAAAAAVSPAGETPAPATPAADKPADPAKPVLTPPAPAAAQAPAPAPATAAAKPAEAAAKKYAEDLARLKAKVVLLQDQETTVQLQISDLRNQVLSPVTDTTARAQAQTKLEQTQAQLTATQRELADARRAVQVMEAQGPPKP